MDPSATASPTAAASDAAAAPRPKRTFLPTTVSLQVSSAEITACNTPRLFGRVTDIQGKPVANAEVKLSNKQYNGTKFTQFAVVRTNGKGEYAMTVRPLVDTTYTGSVGDAESPTVPVSVHTRVVVESPTGGSASTALAVGGRLVPVYVKVPVTLGYIYAGRYVVLGRANTTSQGYFDVTGRPARGRHTFVVSTPAREGNRAGEQRFTLTIR